MSAGETYHASEARLGSMRCDECRARRTLVPLAYEGSLSDVVAARVRAFNREHDHGRSAPHVHIVLPMPSAPSRSQKIGGAP